MSATDEERRIDRVLNRSKLSKEQLRTLNKVYKEELAKGLTTRTIANKLEILERFGLSFKKPYEKATKKDTINYFSKINKHYQESSLTTIRINVKWFYKWLGKPEAVEWIKTTSNGHKYKMPEELLTQKEIKTLVDNSSSQRNKAIIMLLYDGALRVGELINLKIKNLVFDNYGGYIVIPKGKTGMRKIRLVDSIPYLKNYINNEHPKRDDVNSYLFVGIGGKGSQKRTFGRQLDDGCIRIMLYRLADRCNIKKQVYPHLFRHTKMTEMAKDFTEQEMKVFAGWTGNSNMPQVYVHLSGQDIENKILEKRGLIKTEDKEKKNLLEPKKCIDPSCNHVNPVTAKFCEKCHRPLDVKTIIEQEKEASKTMSKFNKESLIENLKEELKKEILVELGLSK